MNNGKNKRQEALNSRMKEARAESLVTDWANSPMEYPFDAVLPFSEATKSAIARSDAAIERLLRRYPESIFLFSRCATALSRYEDPSSIATTHWWIVAKVQRFLRLAWDAPNLREREWHLFKARDVFHSSTVWEPMWEARLRESSALTKAIKEALTPEEDAAQVSAPQLTPFEQAFYHLHRIAKRMRHCGNSECPAPCFSQRRKARGIAARSALLPCNANRNESGGERTEQSSRNKGQPLFPACKRLQKQHVLP